MPVQTVRVDCPQCVPRMCLLRNPRLAMRGFLHAPIVTPRKVNLTTKVCDSPSQRQRRLGSAVILLSDQGKHSFNLKKVRILLTTSLDDTSRSACIRQRWRSKPWPCHQLMRLVPSNHQMRILLKTHNHDPSR